MSFGTRFPKILETSQVHAARRHLNTHRLAMMDDKSRKAYLEANGLTKYLKTPGLYATKPKEVKPTTQKPAKAPTKLPPIEGAKQYCIVPHYVQRYAPKCETQKAHEHRVHINNHRLSMTNSAKRRDYLERHDLMKYVNDPSLYAPQSKHPISTTTTPQAPGIQTHEPLADNLHAHSGHKVVDNFFNKAG